MLRLHFSEKGPRDAVGQHMYGRQKVVGRLKSRGRRFHVLGVAGLLEIVERKETLYEGEVSMSEFGKAKRSLC